jgi:hypothetical protein
MNLCQSGRSARLVHTVPSNIYCFQYWWRLMSGPGTFSAAPVLFLCKKSPIYAFPWFLWVPHRSSSRARCSLVISQPETWFLRRSWPLECSVNILIQVWGCSPPIWYFSPFLFVLIAILRHFRERKLSKLFLINVSLSLDKVFFCQTEDFLLLSSYILIKLRNFMYCSLVFLIQGSSSFSGVFKRLIRALNCPIWFGEYEDIQGFSLEAPNSYSVGL